jgi:hypothetical protein
MICSTSRIDTRRPAWPIGIGQLGDRGDEALRGAETSPSGARTLSHSTRMMRSTSCTRKPRVRLLYSVTIMSAALLREARQRARRQPATDRDDVAAQRDEALDAGRHVRRAGDHRRAGHLAHLEDVDAEDLAGAQREQQDLHAVGARQLGAGIDAVEQRLVGDGHGVPTAGFTACAPGPAPGASRRAMVGRQLRLELGDVFVDPDRLTQLLVGHPGESEECISTGMPAKRGSP